MALSTFQRRRLHSTIYTFLRLVRPSIGPRFRARVLDCRFCPFAVTDLLCSELATTNAATPARRCGLGDEWHWLLIGVPGSHQFAIAVWTQSLNHKLLHQKRFLTLWRTSC